MKNGTLIRIAVGLILLGFASACQNPQAVRQLATMSAANVSTIRAGITELAGESERVAQARARNIALQHAMNTRLRAELVLDRELLKKAGSNAEAAAAQLDTWTQKILAIYAEGEGVWPASKVAAPLMSQTDEPALEPAS